MASPQTLAYNPGRNDNDGATMSDARGSGPPFGPADLFNGRLWWSQIRSASALFLRFHPFDRRAAPPARTLASAARAFPLVGAALGLAGGIAYAILAGLGLPPLLAALAATGALVLLTGALHETQLCQFAERGKDSGTLRLGPTGVIALLMALGARIATIADLEQPGLVIAALVAAGAVSRATLPALARYLPASPATPLERAVAAQPREAGPEEPVAESETAASAPAASAPVANAPGDERSEPAAESEQPEDAAAAAMPASAPPSLADIVTAGGLAALIVLIALGANGLAALVAGAAGAAALVAIARRPVAEPATLGASQQCGEILFLIVLAALA